MRRPKNAEEMSAVARVGQRKMEEFCFVVMSFSNNPVLETYYEEAVVKTVEEFELKCVRVDKEQFDGTITSRIRHDIESASIVIVDTTEDRPNCYFEAGYAVAMKKKIIWQRLDAPTFTKTQIEFDIKDYPHIMYRTAGDLRKKLGEKLEFFLKDYS